MPATGEGVHVPCGMLASVGEMRFVRRKRHRGKFRGGYCLGDSGLKDQLSGWYWTFSAGGVSGILVTTIEGFSFKIIFN